MTPTVAATPETAARARDFARTDDIDTFVDALRRFERGEITAEEWRVFRLTNGTYGQRQDEDAQMLRVKLPQGVLGEAQLLALAEVAERWSRGFAHVTTRQNFQFHFLKLHDVELAMRHLASSGLTTKEACGNTVRNVTACPYAGVHPDEVFDVTPYAEALTRHLLRHPQGGTLPRKFKIAFEGCPEDHAAAAINDLGFFGRLGPDGTQGFRVTVGGGTATLCASGQLLYDWLPASDLLTAAEAVISVFHRLGDREHRQRARMKFLIRQLGFEEFRRLVLEAYAELRRGGITPLPFDPAQPPVEAAPPARRVPPPAQDHMARLARSTLRGPGILPLWADGPSPTGSGFAEWLGSNVARQRQAGYSIATVTLPLGDVTAGQLRALAVLVGAFGDGTARTTTSQNLILRWVRTDDLRALFDALEAAGLGRGGAGRLQDVTSCPGAESCRLAVTQSRGMARLLFDHLEAQPALRVKARGLGIKISGCPNGCGQHHVATIGLQGSVRKLDGRAVPQYFLSLGGGFRDGMAHFGRLTAKIPARRIPETIERLVALFEREAEAGEDASAFFRRIDPARVKGMLADVEALSAEDARPLDFVDLGDSVTDAPTAIAP